MKPQTKAVIKEYAESFAIAVVLALLVRVFVVQAFKIPTGSMNPTLLQRDRILVNKFIYRFKDPQRGDIVVFKYPEDPKKDFVKRLVAVEGERVEIKDGNVLINGQVVEEPALVRSIYYYNRGNLGKEGQEILVPKKSFYVLGDNSGSSKDSRYWGFVPRRYLIGKAFLVYWPPKRIRAIK